MRLMIFSLFLNVDKRACGEVVRIKRGQGEFWLLRQVDLSPWLGCISAVAAILLTREIAVN